LRIVQLTDLHLYADPSGRLLGQNTRHTLELVFDLIRRTFWPADRLILTGDLVHDESEAGYQALHQRLSLFGTPCSCLPGNHDATKPMARALNRGIVSTAPDLRCGTWNLIFLDSTIAGDDAGHLSEGQLARLEATLTRHPQAHALVCLHHQPVPIGSPWMDAIGLRNARDLFCTLDRHPQVRGLLWGHVHQELQAERKGVRLLATPSTCVQFLPASEAFAVDTATPGFRWLELHPDGRISTGVERIARYPDPIDPTADEY
jgi:Icc protein